MLNFVRVTHEGQQICGMDPTDYSVATRYALCVALFKLCRRAMKEEVIPSCSHEECQLLRQTEWGKMEKIMVREFLDYSRNPLLSNLDRLEKQTDTLSNFLQMAMAMESIFRIKDSLPGIRKEFGSVQEIVKNALERIGSGGNPKVALMIVPKELLDAHTKGKTSQGDFMDVVKKEMSSPAQKKWKS